MSTLTGGRGDVCARTPLLHDADRDVQRAACHIRHTDDDDDDDAHPESGREAALLRQAGRLSEWVGSTSTDRSTAME